MQPHKPAFSSHTGLSNSLYHTCLWVELSLSIPCKPCVQRWAEAHTCDPLNWQGGVTNLGTVKQSLTHGIAPHAICDLCDSLLSGLLDPTTKYLLSSASQSCVYEK